MAPDHGNSSRHLGAAAHAAAALSLSFCHSLPICGAETPRRASAACGGVLLGRACVGVVDARTAVRPGRAIVACLAAHRRLGDRWLWRRRLAAAANDLLEKRESLYNNIFIFGDADSVSMTFGQNKRYYTESSMKLSDPGALTVDYTRYMTLGVGLSAEGRAHRRDRPRRRPHGVLSQRLAARHRHPRHRARQGRGRSRQEILQVPGDRAAARGGVRRPGLPAEGHREVGRHPDRRLSRPVRAVPPADQGVLPAGEVAAQSGRRGGAEHRALDHAVRFGVGDAQERVPIGRSLRRRRQHRRGRL